MDLARGFGIVLVVYEHAVRGQFGMIAGRTLPSPHAEVDYVIYCFHMPLFFSLSGFLFVHKFTKGLRPLLMTQLTRVVYPYFLWSILSAVLLMRFASVTNSHFTWDRLFDILWQPIGIYWFLYSLFLCHILAAIYVWLFGSRPIRIAMFAALSAVATAALLAAFPPDHNTHILLDTPRMLFYFAVGMTLERFGFRIDSVTGRIGLSAILVYAAAATFGWFAGVPFEANVVAALAGELAAVWFAAWVLAAAPLGWAFNALGRNTMPIYVMHIWFAVLARVSAARIVGPSHDEISIVLATVAGLLGPTVVQIALTRLNVAQYFGLGSVQRSG